MKKIMLSVLGLSPQVLTEALYALFKSERLVDEIHVITTATGRDLVHSGLLASGQGEFFKFLEEYGIPENRVSFLPENIHVLRDDSGHPLDDIVSPEDNEALVQKCMELAWRLTSKPDQAVYFMIAGGRKTMSASLALAAQFYGRPDDRIFHVLVSPEFEHCREFYYPPIKNRLIATRDQKGNTVYRNTKDARIWLVSMPFVSVRDRLSPEDLDAPRNPELLLASLIRDNPPRLVIDLQESKIVFKGRQVDLSQALMALFTFFAVLRKECGCKRLPGQCPNCFPTWSDIEKTDELRSTIRAIYEQVKDRDIYSAHLSEKGGIINLDFSNFSMYRTKLNKALEKELGPYADEIKITSVRGASGKQYGMRLSPEWIEIKR